MRFSIVIPAYNAEETIKHCIDSVLNQTCQNVGFEILVVDDGSTDATSEIVQTYVFKYSNIVLVRQENAGRLKARQAGYKRAKGDYVLSLDSDDRLDKRCFELLNNVILQQTPDLIMFNALIVPSSRYFLNYGNTKNGFVDYEKIKHQFLISNVYNNLSTKAIKRSLLTCNCASPHKMHFAEDALQMIEVLDNASNVYLLNEPLYIYQQVLGSATHSSNPNGLLDIELLIHELRIVATKWFKDDDHIDSEIYSRFIRALLEFCSKEYTYNASKDILHKVSSCLDSREVEQSFATVPSTCLTRFMARKLVEQKYGFVSCLLRSEGFLRRMKNSIIAWKR